VNALSWSRINPISLQVMSGELFPGKSGAFSYFKYRQIVSSELFEAPLRPDDVSLVNWPQNDYFESNIIDKPHADVDRAFHEARQLSLSLMYWMQTEAGYPGLYLVPELMGTDDGLAKAPYLRESRRIRAEFTVTEGHVGLFARYGKESAKIRLPDPELHAAPFADSVGIGFYRIDLHPSTGGRNYVDISSLPFQIPLGALIPVRMENLLPACKNIGTTHITNGCYRLHPVEWNIGESAAALAAFCLEKRCSPRAVRADAALLEEFQSLLKTQGVEIRWPQNS
jgi:hypothetical protein